MTIDKIQTTAADLMPHDTVIDRPWVSGKTKTGTVVCTHVKANVVGVEWAKGALSVYPLGQPLTVIRVTDGWNG